MQCAGAILPYVVCPPLQYFSTLCDKRHDFREKKLLDIKYTFCFLYNFCLKDFSLKKKWARYDQRCIVSLCERKTLFFSDFNYTLIFSKLFRKMLKYQISWISIQWEQNYSMRRAGRTYKRIDMTKLIVAFHNFVNAPKNGHHSYCLK
jgi:hypothetical protein